MKRKVYQELIDVINAVLAGRDAEPMEDWEAINELAKRHRLCGFVYEAVKFRKDLPEETLRRIRNHFFMAAGQQSRQEHYATELANALRAKGIPYAPLKGICLRRHYPKPTLRMSGDVNFLISPEHREEVASILLGYGFRRDEQTSHSDHYILDHVEMRIHTNLRVRDEGMQDYFANPRERMQSEDGIEFYLTPEDLYILLMGTLRIEFRTEGVGIRSVLDVAILRRTYPDMDRAALNTEFAKIGILGFAESIERLADVWFGDAEGDDDTLLLGKYIAGFGTPEYAELMYASETAEQSAREKRKIRTRKILLPYRVMKMRYPVLRKWGILLPVFWVGRMFAIFFSPKQAESQEEEIHTLRRRAEELAARLRVIAALDEQPGDRLPKPKKKGKK
jgi:hypothetical protein